MDGCGDGVGGQMTTVRHQTSAMLASGVCAVFLMVVHSSSEVVLTVVVHFPFVFSNSSFLNFFTGGTIVFDPRMRVVVNVRGGSRMGGTRGITGSSSAYPVVQQPQGVVGVAGSTVANFKLVVNVGRGTGQIVFGPRFPKPALAHGCFAEVIVAFQITGNHPMVRHRVVEVVGVDGPNDPAPVPTVAGHSGRPLQPVVPHPDRFHGQSFPSVVTDCIDDGALMLH